MSEACDTAVAIVSWPGLARPSTTLPPSALPVVDGRHQAGHDTMGPPTRYFNANAGPAGRPAGAVVRQIPSGPGIYEAWGDAASNCWIGSQTNAVCAIFWPAICVNASATGLPPSR